MPAPGTFPTTFYSQWTTTPRLDPKLSFTGQTIIVTGSNVGLGFHAAQQIAQRGASKVILAVRSVSKGETAAQAIRHSFPPSSRESTIVEVWPLDLSLYQSVKDFAARAINELDRLDVLLANAGVAKLNFELVSEPEDGGEPDEVSIKTNVLSTTLLALLLIPKLKETAVEYGITPRLTFTSSEMAFVAKFGEWKAARGKVFGKDGGLADPTKPDMMDRYQLSKFLELVAVREIALRISSTSTASRPLVIVNAPTPGYCASSLERDVDGLLLHVAVGLLGFVMHKRKPEVGARTLVHAAGSAGVESHGMFLRDCKVYPFPLDHNKGPWGDEKTLRKRVWAEIMEKLERIVPGISSSI
ncbi:NAD-P-binding protein [Stereum hirsutum FP-91666 SS1]|uniref:NAD-P-binding protein n=1 Tax=Stereum hirsutum (strain FP-91666) TaxID=721885 RepID=UPI0004410203|nr:NAD-P-binding protein [Stereum hirsutum FP-91666 SS1]EIM87346.1 NAD-P-binding protein [Stereum hirsutum FP-91666 SS1]